MRIAISGQTYYPGNNGQAIFTIHLAEGLARSGHEVHVIVPHPRFRHEYEVVNGVHVHKVRSVSFAWAHPEAFFPFLSYWAVEKIFRQFRPDVVHIQDHYFVSRDAARVARQMNIPLVGTNHFLPENLLPYLNLLPVPRKTKITALWNLMLWTYNHLDMVTTPTETAASILAGQKIHVPVNPVSCGVDTHYFRPSVNTDRQSACASFGLDPQKIILLYVGRLDGEKRVDLLIRGLALLQKQGRSEICLAVAGQGAAKAELCSLAHALKLDESVRFLGYVANENLPLLYQTADLFAMPSPQELQSIATLEAMASARPVLAANARALPELVTHRVNGYLFEQDQVESVAQGMAYLLDHRDQWQVMGYASRSRAVAHSLDNTIRRYEEIYRKVRDKPQKAAERVFGANLKTAEE
jgi:1,2-diacylglycerol 3-alpha-glucosyltransferase